MGNKVLKVYDTFTKELVDVEVSEEVYKAYKRTEWSINKKDAAFRERILTFSELKGEVENFNEMMSDEDSAKNAETKIFTAKLREALKVFSESDKELIKKLFFENKTERECAEYYGINQKNINKKKQRILCSLNKLLNK